MNTKGQYSDLRSFDDRVSGLNKSLEEYMLESKAYLNSNLSLKQLASDLITNQTYLSLLLNKVYKSSFNDYINKLRVEEACRLLKKSDKDKLDMDQVWQVSGFNSRATFYSSFRKFTGLGPVGYQKSYLRKVRIINQLNNMTL